MARYLTPSRITTLLLIDQYRKEDCWQCRPETCETLLSLIAQQCLSPIEEDNSLVDIANTYENDDIESILEPLSALDARLPGRPWSSLLLQRVWSLKTVDELNDLFETCTGLLASPAPTDSHPDEAQAQAITRASPIGQFIRRCQVEFTKLQFAETIVLWKAFVAYKEPSKALWAQQYPDAARELEQLQAEDPLMALSTLSVANSSSVVSIDRVEALLAASVSQLQKFGHRVPREVKTKVKDWLLIQQSHSTSSLQNFMSSFDAWRAGQYNIALENLHRYFDYTVAKGEGEEMKTHYQYALLHLSVLHADFEHWEESVNAMRECIATARENQDSVCLNFALSWLLYLRHSRNSHASSGLTALATLAGEGRNEQEELAFLKSKAREGKHWTLMSSTILEEAKLELRHNGVCAKAFELIWQSSHLNVEHGLTTLMPAQMLFQAASFDRLGEAYLARQSYEALLSRKDSQISFGDRTRTACRLAYDLAQRGLYDDSIAILQQAKNVVHGTLKLQQKVMAFAEAVGLLRAVRKHDLYAAEHYLLNLRPARSNADPDLVAIINQLKLMFLIRQDQLHLALEKVNTHLKAAQSTTDGDVAESLILLILKANIFAAAGYANKGFTITLRAISKAQQLNLNGILLEALLAMSRILLELGENTAAQELTQACLPRALESSNGSVTAQLFVLLGEAYVGLASEQDFTSPKKKDHALHTAAAFIERGRAEYAKIEDRDGQLDCLLMKARLARITNDEKAAESAEDMYDELVAQHEQQMRR